MAENCITLRLCDEDRARLDKILAALEANGAKNCAGCVESAVAMTKTALEPQETSAPAEPAPQETPTEQEPAEKKEAQKEPETAQEPTPTKPAVTLEQIQQKVVKLAAAGKKAEVKNVITKYGLRVSDLKDQPEKWDEVWAKLTALEG